jgi:hypothetical protein
MKKLLFVIADSMSPLRGSLGGDSLPHADAWGYAYVAAPRLAISRAYVDLSNDSGWKPRSGEIWVAQRVSAGTKAFQDFQPRSGEINCARYVAAPGLTSARYHRRS